MIVWTIAHHLTLEFCHRSAKSSLCLSLSTYCRFRSYTITSAQSNISSALTLLTIPMDSLPDYQIRLLILDQLQPRAQIPNLLLDRRYLLCIAKEECPVAVEAISRSATVNERERS